MLVSSLRFYVIRIPEILPITDFCYMFTWLLCSLNQYVCQRLVVVAIVQVDVTSQNLKKIVYQQT